MKKLSTLLGCAGILLTCAGGAAAAVVIVNTGSDPIDIDWQTATIDDLPGPDGKVSFSEAMIATNNTPGADVVGFNIPQSEWSFQFLFPGRAVVQSSYTYFWRASDEVTVDGTTQTAFTGDTNPDGAEVVLYGGGVSYNADGCEVYGLDSGSFGFSASNNVASGNTGGVHITLFGGSGSLIQGNVCGTIKIDRSHDNVVVGNIMNRVRVLGGGPDATNNRVGGPDPADRNFITGYGTWNSEGLPAGAAVQIFASTGTLVENNWIGTTPDGLEQGNLACTMGLAFEGENHDAVIRNNLIAGILGHGQGPHHAGQLFGRAIYISGNGGNLLIEGNSIGLDSTGEPVLGSVTGVDVGTWAYQGITEIQIMNNTIAGHIFDGITVGSTVTSARITGNAIHDNGNLGIDLITTNYVTGVTSNDALDADTGGNGLQNFPELAEAISDGFNVKVSGALHSSPSSAFTVEFFASPDCDPTGHGEGQVYLGATSVTTNQDGEAAFEAMLTAVVAEGWVVTATATLEPEGATSEFGACVAVTGSPISAALDQGQTPPLALLGRPWPNPANPRISVELSLPRAGTHRVRVVDARGRSVATLLDGVAAAGTRVLQWDGLDSGGRTAPSGVYFVQLVGVRESVQRFTLVR